MAITPRGFPLITADQTYALVDDYNKLATKSDAEATVTEARAQEVADAAKAHADQVASQARSAAVSLSNEAKVIANGAKVTASEALATVRPVRELVDSANSKADSALSAAEAAYAYNQALVAPAADVVNAVLADDTSDARQTLARIAPLYDLTATGTASDALNVVAAAERIAPTGRKVIRLAPGHYDFAGVTVADIEGLYLVGDGVTVTRTSWVYPFTTAEWSGASVEQTRGAGGRGRVAFELDDGVTDHWQHIFPLTKELGITLGSAWHTGQDSPWITEAHRHGWEIISHLPENITAVDYLARGELDIVAEQSLARIEEMIGTRANIGLVYPQHGRSNETDRVLSKYYTRARGLANTITHTPDQPNAWLTASTPIDSVLASGNIPDSLRHTIHTIANNNQSVVFYFHYQAGEGQTKKNTLRKLVAILREEGVEIVNPGQIVGDHNLIADRYLTDRARWAPSGICSFDTTTAYHGTTSAKFSGSAGGNGALRMADQAEVPTRPGMFTAVRASWRRRSIGTVNVTAAGQGFRFTVATRHREWGSGSSTPSEQTASITWPTTGTTLPSTGGQWVREQTLCYLPPSTQSSTFNVFAQNVAAGSADMWVDEVQVVHVDYVSAVSYRVRLTGTGNVFLYTGIPSVNDQVITMTPVTPLKGALTRTAIGSNGMYFKSTSAEDTGEVDVVITPRGSIVGALTSEGA